MLDPLSDSSPEFHPGSAKNRSSFFLNSPKGIFFAGQDVIIALVVFLLSMLSDQSVYSQPEVFAWGNMRGIRVKGELMEFETSLVVVGKDWTEILETGKERQLPAFYRNGNEQIVTTKLGNVFIRQTVTNKREGLAGIDVEATAGENMDITGLFFVIKLIAEDYARSIFSLKGTATDNIKEAASGSEFTAIKAERLSFGSDRRQIDIISEKPLEVHIRKDKTTELYIKIASGYLEKEVTADISFELSAGGEIDRGQVELIFDNSDPGRVFEGFGGNFRLQNPQTDPPVIEYNLENLRLAWARVEMPWRFWHPDEDKDPITEAKAGNLHPGVHAAMEMARRLHERGLPVMLAAWSGPDWAISGTYSPRPDTEGVWGNPLDPVKAGQIYESIAAYIIYMKENYGVEAAMFSFNESDLGIYIRQSGEEHRELIKGLGTYMEWRGLATKLLLGDTADANGYEFIYPAMVDKETHPFIGAVSFHSWRGWDNATLNMWHKAASALDIPLMVGEGSIDAAAWRYPEFFEEPVYAMEEIDLYIRILDICQPMSILQWQLTADYSLLAGGGVFGDDTRPLQPTRRFWNMKQLASTPERLQAMRIHSTGRNITSAALGDKESGIYAIHLVNNGASRKAVIKNIPDGVRFMQVHVTGKEKQMQQGRRLRVRNNRTKLILDSMSYISLFTIN